jgi:ankyrin repeat protein
MNTVPPTTLNNKLLELCQRSCSVEEFRACLELGADPNTLHQVSKKNREGGEERVLFGKAPLHYVIHCPKKTRILLEFGADPNTKQKHDGAGPLHLAAYEGLTKTCQLLLETGADPNSHCERGYCAIHYSIIGHEYIRSEAETLKCLRTLLQYGADPNIKTKRQRWNNQTPLIMVASQQTFVEELCQELLKFGADPSIKDDSGCNALDYTQNEDKEALSALITRYKNVLVRKRIEQSESKTIDIA